MQPDILEVWNVSAMLAENVQVINSTSNALERYNKHIGTALGIHPSLPVFIHKLDMVSQIALENLELQFEK